MKGNGGREVGWFVGDECQIDSLANFSGSVASERPIWTCLVGDLPMMGSPSLIQALDLVPA